MEVCSACGGSVLFVDSKVSIAPCWLVMSIVKQSRLNRTFQQEKEFIG